MSNNKKYLFVITLGAVLLIVFIIIGIKLNSVNPPANNNSKNVTQKSAINNEPTQIDSSASASSSAEEIIYPESGEIDMSDWQTLRDGDWGIELMYPKSWKVIQFNSTPSEYSYAFKSPGYQIIHDGPVEHLGEIYFHNIKNNENLSILDLFDTFNDTSTFWPQKYKYRETKINGHDAIVFEEIDGGRIKRKDVSIKYKDKVFSLSYLYEKKNDAIERIFDKVTSTLKSSN